MDDSNHRPALSGVIADLCHHLGVDAAQVMAIQIAPGRGGLGTVDVAMRCHPDLEQPNAGIWRRFTFPLLS